MFIKLKVAKVSEETAEQNELLGKDEYEDEDVFLRDVRVNIKHIVNYEDIHHNQCEIELVTGTLMYIQETAEVIDQKIKDAQFSNLIN